MRHVHGRMPVTLVYSSRVGAPVSTGRDGTIRTYAVEPELAADVDKARAAGLPSEDGPPESRCAHRAFAAPAGSGPCLDGHRNAVAVPDSVDGAANGGCEPVLVPRESRLQLLTCVAVEAVPGISAPFLDVMTDSVNGTDARFVCGFQARTGLLLV